MFLILKWRYTGIPRCLGIPGSRIVNNLLLFLQLRLYGDPGRPAWTGFLVEATEIPVKRDKLCPYKRNIPIHREEVKWNLKRRLTRENLQKRKQKETTFIGMLFMQTKLVFVLLTNYYKLFHAFFNEVNTSRSPETSRVPRSYKPAMKYVFGNTDIPVYRDDINRPKCLLHIKLLPIWKRHLFSLGPDRAWSSNFNMAA